MTLSVQLHPTQGYRGGFCDVFDGGLVEPDDVASLKYRYTVWKSRHLEISYQI